MNTERQETLRAELIALGFDDVRFTSVDGLEDAQALQPWLKQGMHGDMEWMQRTADKRMDPALVLPAVRSVILLGVNYGMRTPTADARDAAATHAGARQPAPTWARYALHEDYHDTFKPALAAAGRALERLYGIAGTDYRYYVDAGPVLERGWAARAGLGFLGKNAMLISRTFGNWLLLAAILTPIDFQPDPPVRRRRPEERSQTQVGALCGKCTRCLDACPTNAFVAPGQVDARRCISYQTIENRGIIPRELRSGIGARIYGCDVCLEVCPWNRFAHEGRRMLLVAKDGIAQLSLRELLELTPGRYAEVFRRTPIKRVKLTGLLRNACVVAGNLRDRSVLPLLVTLASHASPIVRAHAVWAVYQVAGAGAAASLLREARNAEQDPLVVEEYPAEQAAPTAASC